MASANRPYDVVLYGAAGFTGRQTVAYFAQHAGPDLRWAIAGRSRERLEAARAAAGERARNADILIADSGDQAAVDHIVRQSRVVLNTAGPFALYGTSIVDACVRFGTHYADITGETAWVRTLIDRYHDRAAAGVAQSEGSGSMGIRIVNCCGFDSVPSDLGAFLMARHIQRTGSGCIEVRAAFRMSGGLNGGTIASMLNMLDSGAGRRMSDPFLLDPAIDHRDNQRARSRDLRSPRHDPDLGAQVGPFFMAPTNTRIVRRSAALCAQWGEPYGPDFVYQEALKFDPPFAPAKATLATGAVGAFFAAMKSKLTRRIVKPLLPKPGAGPSEKTMDRGWFTCDLVGIAADGRKVRGTISHAGDPGNRATVRFVCEAALALAGDIDALPGGATRGGVLTPATALGDVYAERLRRAGVTIDIPT